MQPIIGGGQFSKYELQRAPLIFECVRRKQREDNKQSREEKTQGGKDQEEEERPGRLAIHARNWERRFRQEILVANVLVPASNVGDREFIGAFSLALIRDHCRSVDGGPVSIRGELASWHSTFGWRR